MKLNRRSFTALAALPIVAPLVDALWIPDFVVHPGQTCVISAVDGPRSILVKGGGTLEAMADAVIERLDLEPGANCDWHVRMEGDKKFVAKVRQLNGLENESSVQERFREENPPALADLRATAEAQKDGILLQC
ncbi:MAG TPA: hypothetical protein VG125_19660 [Pirellulales bacterium]|nr:hypothetical protein [Pirellulales bacterium]